jgi:hypothetical protein
MNPTRMGIERRRWPKAMEGYKLTDEHIEAVAAILAIIGVILPMGGAKAAAKDR